MAATTLSKVIHFFSFFCCLFFLVFSVFLVFDLFLDLGIGLKSFARIVGKTFVKSTTLHAESSQRVGVEDMPDLTEVTNEE
jgi:hypothetical protein